MERENLKSRLGFILLSAGCAIGIGNVWKFPYMAGQGGGGAFVLFYLIFLVLLGLPIMTMEFAVGRASKKSPCLLYTSITEYLYAYPCEFLLVERGDFHNAAGCLEEMCIRDRVTTRS